jgi:hypothetical protein
MRSANMLILLALLMAFSVGTVLAQDALNATNVTTAQNITNNTTVTTSVAEPVSKYKQLSNYTEGEALVLGKNIVQEYSDVTTTADKDSVFSREAGTTTPAVKVSITNVNMVGEKYVEVANLAVGAWDLTGWTLSSAGDATYTFPEFVLDDGLSVRIHEGNGPVTKTDLYTNSTAPLWIDDEISLQNAEGNAISKYDLLSAPDKTKWSNPLNSLIQY